MSLKWLFFFVFTTFCFGYEAILIYSEEESLRSAIQLSGYLIAVASCSLGAIYLLSKIAPKSGLVLVAIFMALSIVSLKLLYYPFFQKLPLFAVIATTLIAASVIWLLLSKIPLQGSPGLVPYVVVVAILVATPHLSVLSKTLTPDLDEQESNLFGDLERIRLNDKPNIYLLSYDSMIPAYTAEKYLNIETLDYQSIVDEKFVSLAPSVSISVPTRPSLNALMQLDQYNLESSAGYFSGRKPSALSHIFRNNGYELTTGYESYYFGAKGPFVDRYIVGAHNLSKTTLCIETGNSISQKMRAYGACSFMENKSFLEGSGTEKAGLRDWHSTILQEIASSHEQSAPQIKVFYTYNPIGHTSGDYVHADHQKRVDYRDQFQIGASRLAAQLSDISAFVAEHDPNSIVIVFGDHGTWTSRVENAEDNPTFFYEDRHIIYLGALSTTHPCATKERLLSMSGEYSSPSRVVGAILSCLSDDANNVKTALNFKDPPAILRTIRAMNKD